MCIKHLAYMVTQKMVPCKILFEMLILDLAIQRQSAKAECAKFTLATRTQDEWQRGTRERCPCWGPRAPGDSGGHGWDSERWSRGDTWLSCETGTETSQSPQLYIASAAMVYKACSMGHRFPGRGKECHSETNFGKVAWDGSLLAESECASACAGLGAVLLGPSCVSHRPTWHFPSLLMFSPYSTLLWHTCNSMSKYVCTRLLGHDF